MNAPDYARAQRLSATTRAEAERDYARAEAERDYAHAVINDELMNWALESHDYLAMKLEAGT